MEANMQPLYMLDYLKGFSQYEYDCDRLYYHLYNRLPSHWIIGDIELKSFYRWLAKGEVSVAINHQFNVYIDKNKSKKGTISQLFILSNKMVLEVEPDSVKLIYDHTQSEEAENLVHSIARYRKKKTANERIRLITMGSTGYETSSIKFNKPKINLSQQYNDDLLPVHEKIIAFLRKKSTSGLILFHGLPGTGKSTYIRYLAGMVNKPVIFLPSAVANLLDSPSMVQILIKYSNSIFILEDAEELLVSRENQRNSGISILLNLTDGFLGNCLGIQFIATFNTHIRNIDKALLRKGRLVARYEFGPLTPEKSTGLLQSINPNAPVSMRPMTLSEIYHPEHAGDAEVEQKPGIGFLGRAV